MCLEASERVSAMCEHFQHIDEVIEFITAINQLFKFVKFLFIKILFSKFRTINIF